MTGNPRRPFLAVFGVPLSRPRAETIRYDQRRMLLMAGEVPAVWTDMRVDGDTTTVTRIRNETTDDS
jgi:hypothetical protein